MAIKDLKLSPKQMVLAGAGDGWAGSKKTVPLDRGRFALLEQDGVSAWIGEYDELREEGDKPNPARLKKVFRVPFGRLEHIEFMTEAEAEAQRSRADDRAAARARQAELETARAAAQATQAAAGAPPSHAVAQMVAQPTGDQSIAAQVAATSAQQQRALQRAMEANQQSIVAHGSK